MIKHTQSTITDTVVFSASEIDSETREEIISWFKEKTNYETSTHENIPATVPWDKSMDNAVSIVSKLGIFICLLSPEAIKALEWNDNYLRVLHYHGLMIPVMIKSEGQAITNLLLPNSIRDLQPLYVSKNPSDGEMVGLLQAVVQLSNDSL